MFNTDPKSAALKNAMAKRRYNAVPLRRRNPLQGLREVEGGLTHFFVAVGFF